MKKTLLIVVLLGCLLLNLCGWTPESIVIAPEPAPSSSDAEVNIWKETKLAADNFNKYFKTMTSRSLPVHILDKDRIPERGAVYLGKAAESVFSQDELNQTGYFGGFRIRESKGNVYIAGRMSAAPYFGMIRILRENGAEFYAWNCEVIPAGTGLEIRPGTDILDVPFYEIRSIDANGDNLGWTSKIRHMHDRSKAEYCFHNMAMYLDPEVYGEKHPEYYAEIRGRRTFPAKLTRRNLVDTHLCLSNVQAREEVTKNAIKYLEKMNDRVLFTITSGDGSGYCTCANCKALGNIQDQLIFFLNPVIDALKAKFPEKNVGSFAYYKSLDPPAKGGKYTPNAKIWLCAYTPHVQDKGHWFDHPANSLFLPHYEYWTRTYPGQIYIYEYPFVWNHALSFPHEQLFYRLKRYARDGVRGMWFDGRPSFMTALAQYVAGELLWNPEQETEPLIAKFCRAYYGTAKMKLIYDHMAKIAARQDRIQGVGGQADKFIANSEALELLVLFDEIEKTPGLTSFQKNNLIQDKLLALNSYLRTSIPGQDDVKTRLSEFLKLIFGQEKLRKAWAERAGQAFEHVTGRKVSEDFFADKRVIALKDDPGNFILDPVASRPYIAATETGWDLPLGIWQGKHVLRQIKGKTVYPVGTAAIGFMLPFAPGATSLALTAINGGKLSIRVNGQEIYQGASPFNSDDFTVHKFPVSPGVFKRGSNEITVTATNGDILCHALHLDTGKPLGHYRYLTFSADFQDSTTADFALGNPRPITGEIQRGRPELRIDPNEKALDAGVNNPKDSAGIRYSTDYQFNHSQGYLEMEIKQPARPPARQLALIFSNAVPHYAGMYMAIAANGQIQFTANADRQDKEALGYIGSSSSMRITSGKNLLPLQEYVKIAFSWDDDTHLIRLYINGNEAAAAKIYCASTSVPGYFCIGGHSSAKIPAAAYGYIRNLRIYNVSDPLDTKKARF